MIAIALWLLAAEAEAPARQVLLEETLRLADGEQRRFVLAERRGPGRIDCVFQVIAGNDSLVRATLYAPGDSIVGASGWQRTGRASADLRSPATPVVAFESRQAADVRLRVLWRPDAESLPAWRMWITIAASIGIFGAILYFVGGYLWRVTAYRRRHGYPPDGFY